MPYRSSIAILLLLLLAPTVHAVEFTGRFSMLGTTAVADAGDFGYQSTGSNALSADQQSVRLMLDDVQTASEWSIHLRTVRQHLNGFTADAVHSSDLFRYRYAEFSLLDERDTDNTTSLDFEYDRFFYRKRLGRYTLALGRQAIDWGSGRLWQPLNVFGAFAPTDLDTDYKPGIDAITVDAYPGAFSSLTGAYVLGPKFEPEIEDSAALHYRSQLGESSELTLVAGKVIGNQVVGTAFESALGGMGWRVEGLYYKLEQSDERAFFWIAGIDYLFENGTSIILEWYDNSRGALYEYELGAMSSDPLVVYGLQQHLSRQVLGMSLQRDLTPLLKGGYTLLASALRDENNQSHISLLHQLYATYSVSNESDLLMSVILANGKGLNRVDEPQSEFGHLANSASLRLRFYF